MYNLINIKSNETMLKEIYMKMIEINMIMENDDLKFTEKEIDFIKKLEFDWIGGKN